MVEQFRPATNCVAEAFCGKQQLLCPAGVAKGLARDLNQEIFDRPKVEILRIDFEVAPA